MLIQQLSHQSQLDCSHTSAFISLTTLNVTRLILKGLTGKKTKKQRTPHHQNPKQIKTLPTLSRDSFIHFSFKVRLEFTTA